MDARRGALAAGATDFLSKPLDTMEVLLRIKHLPRGALSFSGASNTAEKWRDWWTSAPRSLQKRSPADLERALVDLKETQLQVIQQERLKALGTMASGIAHDLNNGLSLILGYGDMLLGERYEKFPLDSKERDLS